MTRQRIEDRIAIEDRFTRYMWAIDTGDVDTLVDCFTEDAALESPAVGAFSGHDKIRRFAQRFARFRENGNQLRHVISNMVVEVDGDEASARCYLVVFITRDDASRLLGPGRYDCQLRRVAGEWRFTRRAVVMDHDYELEGL